MDALWLAYVAGFFDGEGSVTIARNRSAEYSDYHKIIVAIGQRSKHRGVLDRICSEFGGRVLLQLQESRVSKNWAEHAKWQLQSRSEAERFLIAIQPYVVIKAPQVSLGLEFVSTFSNRAETMRDALGRIRGRMLNADEIMHREQLRLRMREMNELGPPRVSPSQLPPLDLRHRQTPERFDIDVTTVQRGTKRYNAKLTDQQVRAIRVAHAEGIKMAELARQYSVSFMLISGIVKRTRWAHVPDILPEGD